MRPETGPMKFGDDWTGLFIRGDNAMYYKTLLNIVCGELSRYKLGEIEWAALESLMALLGSTNEFITNNETQLMKDFVECKK